MILTDLRGRARSLLRETPLGLGLARFRDFAIGLRAWRRTPGRGAAAILYHGVAEEITDAFVEAVHVEAGLFRRQVRHLKEHHTIVPLEEIVAVLESGGQPADDWVTLTFDDGYRNNLTCAMDILHQEGRLPMTLFAVSDFIGSETTMPTVALKMCILYARAARLRIPQPGGGWRELDLRRRRQRANAYWMAHEALRACAPDGQAELMREFVSQLGDGELEEIRRRFPSFDWLDWDELRELAGAGAEVGSHGCSHVSLGRATGRDRVRHEIVESRRRIRAELGRVSDHFAYPYGTPADVSEAAIEALGADGVRSALTAVSGTLRAGDPLLRLARLSGCVQGMGRFRRAVATGRT